MSAAPSPAQELRECLVPPARELGNLYQKMDVEAPDDGPAAPVDSLREFQVSSRSGGSLLIPCLISSLFGTLLLIFSIVHLCSTAEEDHGHPSPLVLTVAIAMVVTAALVLMGTLLMCCGLHQIQPNEALVLSWFGAYSGSVRSPGLRFVNPFYNTIKFSLRLRTIETKYLKVNDKTGTPVEIGAIVVWRVVDTAKAKFHVNDYEKFVFIQAEAALRALAMLHPYDVLPLEERDSCNGQADGSGEEEISLRGHAAAVAAELRAELQCRIGVAGVEVVEARISHLAYAPEIAHAMLQRQQARAVVAARKQIVEGAVGILKTTVNGLEEHFGMQVEKSGNLDLNRLVTNLLTVLVSQDHVQPVISTQS